MSICRENGCLGCSFCCDEDFHFTQKQEKPKVLTFSIGDKLSKALQGGKNELRGKHSGSVRKRPL